MVHKNLLTDEWEEINPIDYFGIDNNYTCRLYIDKSVKYFALKKRPKRFPIKIGGNIIKLEINKSGSVRLISMACGSDFIISPTDLDLLSKSIAISQKINKKNNKKSIWWWKNG